MNTLSISKKYLFYLLFILLTYTRAYTQTSYNDSIALSSYFNTNLFFTENYLGNEWYNIPKITSPNDLTYKLNYLYKFSPQEYKSSYSKIKLNNKYLVPTINNSFNSLFPSNFYSLKNNDAIQALSYSLNGKTDTSNFIFTKCIDSLNSCNKVGILIIPGSGANQSYITAWGTGYNASLCNVNIHLSSLGDCYTLTKNNEDYRAIRFNHNKINTFNLENILNGADRNSGINYVIQAISLVKYLKNNYKKVIVLGLSEGGYASLLTSLESEPDGSIVSSGYSIMYDYDPYFTTEFNRTFGYTFNSTNRNQIKSTISSKNTNYLFSYGINEGIQLFNIENVYDSTVNFLNSNKVSKSKNFIGHAYPYCNSIDSFFNKIVSKPKAFINKNNLCTSDSLKIKIRFCGVPPFHFSIVKGNLLIGNFTTTTDTFQYTLYNEGKYVVNNLVDATNNLGFISDTFEYKKAPYCNHVLTSLYDCDSNLNTLKFNLLGTSPWNFKYNFNNIITDTLLVDSNYTLKVPNGVLTINSLKDSNTCFSLNTNNIINVINNPVNISFSSLQYNCDSNKTAIPILLSGKAPWIIKYKKNTIPYTIITSSNNYSVLLSNGTYLFETVSDSNNCTKTINQVFNINSQPLSYSFTNPIYNCDSNKSKINFTLNGNPPFTVYYRRNNTSLFFSTTQLSVDKYFNNGYYIFDSIKDASCLKKISPTIQHTFYYQTLNFSASSPTYICDSNKAKINFTLQGNPPYTISYSQNGIANQFVTSQNTIDKYYSNGIYNFSKITDATQCNLNFNILKNINFDTLGVQLSNPIYNCDSNKSKIQFTFNGNSPWTVYYKKNNVPLFFTSTNSAIDLFFGNGNYSFDSVKDASCVKKISPSIQHTFNYTPTSTSVSTPFYNCDSNKTMMQFACQGNSPYTIFYTQNGILNQFTTNTNFTNKLFNNGLYYFVQSIDNLNCNAPINQVQNINFQSINYTITNLGYNCDSDKTKLNFTLTGNAPWTIFYRRNNIPQTISTSTINNDFYFLNGIYIFDSIKDATCTKPMLTNNQFNFSYNPISVIVQNPVYSCDSNKAFIKFNFSGNPPYTLNYTKDGIPYSITTSSNNYKQFFPNGFYYFIDVTDNTNCQKSLNLIYNIQFNPLNYSIDTPKFICDSVKTKFQFHFQGNAPWTVFYKKNNSPNSFTTSNPNYSLLTTNGIFNFDSLKDATCSKIMNPSINYNINNSLLNVIMDTPIYDCNVNKVKVHFQFQGNAPWQIHYFKIGVPNTYNTLTTYANNYDAYFNSGNYIIDSVTDNSNCTKVYNAYIDNNYSPIGCIKTATTYNCDSNKTQINYQLFGDAPWTITYLNIDSNSIVQEQTNSANCSLFLKNGNYVIQSITDFKCTKIIADSLQLNVPKLTSSISAEAISCDSNKMYVIINATSGNPPYSYKYYKNNILQTKTSYSATDTFYLDNGAYFFERMSDSIGCEVVFNKNVVVEYNPFFFNNITNIYNCEKDSTLVKFDITNYNDVYLQYTKNNSPISSLTIDFKNQDFYFSNGNYHWINIMDSIGCIKPIDQYLEINNEPININKDSIVKDCENREYIYQLSFDGKSPWKINYNKNNILQTETFFNENNNWTLPAGKYYFINVTDSNLCSMDILRQDTLIQFLNQNPVITYSNNKIIATQIPFNYTWYKDNIVIPNEKSNVITPYGNGIYAASVTDSAGCIYYSNTITLNFPEDINLYPNPSSDKVNITVNANYGDYWEYTLHDMFGNQIAQDRVSLPYKQINVQHLAKGVYHFIIKFSAGYDADKKVIRFMKN